jgi:hypothetical protein
MKKFTFLIIAFLLILPAMPGLSQETGQRIEVATDTLIGYQPACFYQADTGNMPLIMCPPLDSTGAIPENFLGFNLYLDGYLVNFLPPSTTSYILLVDQPGIYSCWLTAVYDLSPFGYPNETGESPPLFTEYIVRWGYPLPFLETWALGNFDDNNWLSDGPNWTITGQSGNPSPSAEFTWDPIQSDYSMSLESFPLQADSMTEGQISLDFDIKLISVVPTGTEQLLVQVWNWESQVWATVKTYSNQEGYFDWISEHLDITNLAMHQIFKIRFLAQGENSINILSWFLDNIHVYRACNPPLNLDATLAYNPFGMVLNWESPEGIPVDQWIHWDDGVNYNAVGIGAPTEMDVAARWEPGQLTEFEGDSITQISFFPNEVSSSYKVRVWQGAGAANLVVDQEVPSPVIGQWNYIMLNTPVPIDITQELWVGYQFTGPNGYPVGVDNGPAIDGFGNMIQFGGNWQTLLEINPDLDYNWNIEAFIQQNSNYDTLIKYAIYRSDNFEPYYLRDYADQNYYLDDSSICDPLGSVHMYKITALYTGENDTCESGYSNESGDWCEGINDQDEKTFVSIYPNPANDFIHIESMERMDGISIYDSRGDKVIKWYGDEGEVEIPVSKLVPGLYLVRVETDKETISRKIVIIR